MKSYWMHSTQDRGVLEMRDVPVPVPGPKQLLLRMRAAGLNRGEFIAGHGLNKPGSVKPVGIEGAGEVVEAGSAVAGFASGDRVFGRFAGAFSEYALIDECEAMRMPEGLSWEEAASVPLTFGVVYDMLVAQGRIAPGNWVLVTGVSSGVGVTSLQMAKALGANVIGTSGSADKLGRLRPLNLDVGLCTRAPDFHDAVMQVTDGRGVDIVVNTVGGSVFPECMRSMAFEGRLATVGYVDGTLRSEIDLGLLHSKRLTLFGVSNKLRTTEQRAQTNPGLIADILPLIAAGRIRPLIDRVFPFDQLETARSYMESNSHVGKIVLTAS